VRVGGEIGRARESVQRRRKCQLATTTTVARPAALRFGAASTRILTCFTHSPFRVRDDGPNETACRPPLPASTAPLHALIPSTPCARPDRVRASLGS
jgi:hypothetical protein